MRGAVLTQPDRGNISRGIAEGLSRPRIVAWLGCDHFIVDHEINRCGSCKNYCAVEAQERAVAQASKMHVKTEDLFGFFGRCFRWSFRGPGMTKARLSHRVGAGSPGRAVSFPCRRGGGDSLRPAPAGRGSWRTRPAAGQVAGIRNRRLRCLWTIRLDVNFRG